MKIFDTFLFCFSILLMLIGIHQAMMFGFPAAYWLFMLSLGSLLWYQIRKKNQLKTENDKNSSGENKSSQNTSRKRKYKM